MQQEMVNHGVIGYKLETGKKESFYYLRCLVDRSDIEGVNLTSSSMKNNL